MPRETVDSVSLCLFVSELGLPNWGWSHTLDARRIGGFSNVGDPLTLISLRRSYRSSVKGYSEISKAISNSRAMLSSIDLPFIWAWSGCNDARAQSHKFS